jgi:hypothetical protein
LRPVGGLRRGVRRRAEQLDLAGDVAPLLVRDEVAPGGREIGQRIDRQTLAMSAGVVCVFVTWAA